MRPDLEIGSLTETKLTKLKSGYERGPRSSHWVLMSGNATETDTQGDGHVKAEAEISDVPANQGCQGLPATSGI